MKISQYCSVCKKSLDMEVVPTDSGEDDGVIWLRCPDCGGFLPKIRSASAFGAQDADDATAPAQDDVSASGDAAAAATTAAQESSEPLPDGESPADTPDLLETDDGSERPAEPKAPAPAEPQEPLGEYAALLAERDPATAVPYRPWSVYAAGDLIHHLAWDDVGVVVAKESLPGNRRIVKVYFEKMGIARLIEGDAKPS